MKPFLITILCLVRLSSYSQDTLISIANEAYINQSYLEAAQLFDIAYQSDSTHVAYAVKSAQALFHAGNLKASKTYITALMTKTRDTLACYKVLAKIYESEGDYAQAIPAYKRLLSVDSTNLMYRKSLAKIYFNVQLFSKAHDEYLTILAAQPSDIMTHINQGECYISQEKDSLAMVSASAAVSLDSTHINARRLRARIAYSMKNYALTSQDLQLLEQQKALNPYYHNMLGMSFMNLDSFDLASKYLMKSFVEKEFREYGFYYLADMAEKQGKKEKAIEYFSYAIEEAISDYTHAYYKRLGDLHLDSGSYKEAILHFEKAYTYKEKPEYIYSLAIAHDSDQNALTSVEYYKKFLDLVKENNSYTLKAKERLAYLEDYLLKTRIP
jgi:tetratricopeptide (TPR) repeat protein